VRGRRLCHTDLRIDGIADGATVARAPNSDIPAMVRLRTWRTGNVPGWSRSTLATTQGTESFEHRFAEIGDQTITAMTDSGNWPSLCACCAEPEARARVESPAPGNPPMPSFDVVSKLDSHELTNAVIRPIATSTSVSISRAARDIPGDGLSR
jgi:hypothetical protein